MKKLNLVLVLMFSLSICTAQNTFNAVGRLDAELLSREYFKILKSQDGKFLVAEKQSVSGISRGGRVLSIRSINQKTLKVAKSKIYKNISTAKRKDEYKFMNIWQTNNEVQVLVMDNKTHDVVMLTIDPKTLVLSKKGKTLFSISEGYNKESNLFAKMFDKDQLFFDTEVVNSENGEYTYVMVYLNEGGEPTTMMSYLIDENGKVISESVLKHKTDMPVNKENTVLNVLDDGRAVIVMNLEDKKGYEYKDLKPGLNVYVISSEGKLDGQKLLHIKGTLPNGDPVEKANVLFSTKGSNLYIAGYDGSGFGTVSGVLDINSNANSHDLTFQPFDKQVMAEFWSTSDKNIEKKKTEIDKGKIETISRSTKPKSITVAENGDFILVGSEDYAYSQSSSGSSRSITYYFGPIVLHRISPTNEIQYVKVIRLSEKSKSVYNVPLYHHKAFEVNGEIVLFVNDLYSQVGGYQMQGEEADRQRGAIVFVSKDGSEWRKEPYELNKGVEVCWVIPTAGSIDEDGAILMPLKNESRINVGYVRFEPNK